MQCIIKGTKKRILTRASYPDGTVCNAETDHPTYCVDGYCKVRSSWCIVKLIIGIITDFLTLRPIIIKYAESLN